jgi:hypothetical protein
MRKEEGVQNTPMVEKFSSPRSKAEGKLRSGWTLGTMSNNILCISSSDVHSVMFDDRAGAIDDESDGMESI